MFEEYKAIEAVDKEAVHKICSGQVVLNLATAVKELVENSLDAKAENIEVRLVEHGLKSVEVIDDGEGIHEDNFQALSKSLSVISSHVHMGKGQYRTSGGM